MKPDPALITITDNEALAAAFVTEKLRQRIADVRWSNLTKQSPAGAFGGQSLQHLASILTGVPGMRSAARGHDHADKSEHKACNRIDQVDKCTSCKERVMRHETTCASCGSDKIKRNEDSKFLLTINSESELRAYTNEIPRVILTLLEYPDLNDTETIKVKVWEIWPEHSPAFRAICEDYYESVLFKKARGIKHSPKNFWPYSFQFFKSRPISICKMTVTQVNTDPHVVIDHYVSPDEDRSACSPEPMPANLLFPNELELTGADPADFLTEAQMDLVPLRLLKTCEHATPYAR